jgi:micrococcal nuclease
MQRVLFLLIALCGAFPGPVWADFAGRVVRVHEGDTLTIRAQRRNISVRLDGIDAPELGQAFGQNSRSALARLCAGKDATVTDRGKDRSGRVIGSVTCAGIDANGEQVRQGMAWVFRSYIPTGSPLYEFESYARLRGLGLWRDSNPVPPWEWRKSVRSVEPTVGSQF